MFYTIVMIPVMMRTIYTGESLCAMCMHMHLTMIFILTRTYICSCKVLLLYNNLTIYETLYIYITNWSTKSSSNFIYFYLLVPLHPLLLIEGSFFGYFNLSDNIMIESSKWSSTLFLLFTMHVLLEVFLLQSRQSRSQPTQLVVAEHFD